MAQPSFSPVPRAGEVRASAPTANPEIGRNYKGGLERSPNRPRGTGFGTPTPGEGYAFTLAERAVTPLRFERPADRHDVVVGVALVAAKRASLAGRSPTLGDVTAAMAYFDLYREIPVARATSRPFCGLSRSYAAQRRFVDAVADAAINDCQPSAAAETNTPREENSEF